MIVQCMRNFLLFIKFKFLWKNGLPEKIKAHLPLQLSALQQLVRPHLFNFIRKILCPTPFKKEDRDGILYKRLQRRDNKVITLLYDRFFNLQNCKVITFEEN